jgi:trans-aconitate 2-methyltransferase
VRSETVGKSELEKSQWDAALYDDKHSFVWKYGEEVVQLLSPQPGERILDIGCGTGHLTHRISLAGAEVTGIDRSPDMIEQARKTYPDLKLVVADASDFQLADPFDAVFSNAALHWMKRADQVASSIARALKPAGRFVAEFGGKGNINAFRVAIEKAVEGLGHPASEDLSPWYFPSIGEYAGLLEAHQLTVTYAILFDRPTPLEDGDNGLRHWMEMFASNFLSRLTPLQRNELIGIVEAELRPTMFRDGTWFADYRRLRIVAIRELGRDLLFPNSHRTGD